MQLDELYNVTPQADRFLFDFDHSDSLMLMDVSATMIRVYGTVYGGRWTVGSGFISDAYLGLYTVDMLYNVGVMPVPGDDDMWVNGPNNANHGLIGTPVGDVIDLWDERGSFNFSFRLGDEDHDRGHRGFSGISGWGWLNHGPDPTIHHDVGDLLFVSHGLIPAPGMGALVLLGLGFAARRRR